jgi:hypothetical protein
MYEQFKPLAKGRHVAVTEPAYSGIIFDQASYDAVVKHCENKEYKVYTTLAKSGFPDIRHDEVGGISCI